MLLEYYTDGSANPNPGPGGWAVIKNGSPYMIGGEPTGSPRSSSNTTNIRMEGYALMAALIDADGEKCTIYTDSNIWVGVLTKWADTWKENGWKKSNKKPVDNIDIVKQLYSLYKVSQAELIWVRGHSNIKLNEMADKIANEARHRKLTDPEFYNT